MIEHILSDEEEMDGVCGGRGLNSSLQKLAENGMIQERQVCGSAIPIFELSHLSKGFSSYKIFLSLSLLYPPYNKP